MVQSVSRALTILKTVADHPNGIGVTDLARVLDVHKSTVSRLIATLESEGAIERVPNSNGFQIGEGILALAPKRNMHDRLITSFKPLMQRLSEQVGEMVGLSIPESDHRSTKTIYEIQSQHTVRVRDWTGERFPLHVASSGKHILARFGEKQLREYLSRPLTRYTPATITDEAVLRERINQVRLLGVDLTIDEFEEGLLAISAPICDKADNVIACLHISMPKYRFRNGTREKTARLLKETCRQATQMVLMNQV